MIYIIDDFLSKKTFKIIKKGALDFKEVKTPGKSFWVKEPSPELIAHFEDRLEAIEGQEVENIFSFFREAKKGQDNEWRIHNDTIIEGQQPDRAIILYIDSPDIELNGTAFWEHKTHGDIYTPPENLEEKVEEFNRLLKEDANDKTKWTLKSVIGYKPNRLISYPSNYFHSKYPNEFKKSRVVFVMFYKII
tara:strand:+ start:83 stop:655 length:573 start_codon:yes stop_codon:yes gene_type:complete